MSDASDFFGVDDPDEIARPTQLSTALSGKRELLVEAEQRLKGMFTELSAMKRQVAEFERAGLGCIVSRLKGNHEARLREMRIMLGKSQVQYEAAARFIAELQKDVAALEKQLAAARRSASISRAALGVRR